MKNILLVLLGLLIGIAIMATNNLLDLTKQYDNSMSAPAWTTNINPLAALWNVGTGLLGSEVDTDLIKQEQIYKARKRIAESKGLPIDAVKGDPRGIWETIGDGIRRYASSRYGTQDALVDAISALNRNESLKLSPEDIQALAKIIYGSKADYISSNSIGMNDNPNLLNNSLVSNLSDIDKQALPIDLLNLYKTDSRFKDIVNSNRSEDINNYIEGYLYRRNQTPVDQDNSDTQETQNKLSSLQSALVSDTDKSKPTDSTGAYEYYAYGPESAIANSGSPTLQSIARQIANPNYSSKEAYEVQRYIDSYKKEEEKLKEKQRRAEERKARMRPSMSEEDRARRERIINGW